MNKYCFLILVALFGCSLAPRASFAVTSDTQFLEMTRQLDFEPHSVTFVVLFDTGRITQLPGLIVAPQNLGGDQTELNRWWFATRVRVPVGATVCRWFGWVEGSSGQFELLSQQSKSLISSESDDSPEALKAIREKLAERLRAANAAIQAQDAQLARVRREADQIGNFGRIIDAQEALARVESELKNLADTSLSVEKFLDQARSFPEPRNARTREQELVSQLAELAEVAKASEHDELARRYRTDREMRHKTEALEAAHTYDVRALRQELKDLTAGKGSPGL